MHKAGKSMPSGNSIGKFIVWKLHLYIMLHTTNYKLVPVRTQMNLNNILWVIGLGQHAEANETCPHS